MEKMNPEKISRDNQADKIIQFLDRIDAYEYFQNILKGEKQKPSFEDFESFLIRLNGIAREIPIKKRSFDGQNVQVGGLIGKVLMPRHEDKADLLKYAYDNIENIDEDEVKYLIPAVINAVHLFRDGNGRTSRVIYQSLEKHASKEEFERDMKLCLGENGRFDSPDISPDLIFPDLEKIVLEKHGWVLKDDEYPAGPGALAVGKGISAPEIRKLDKNHELYDIAKKCFDIYSHDILYMLSAIHIVLGDERIEKFFTDKYTFSKISPLKMMDDVTSDEWQKILNSYYELKKEHVKTIIDSFITPDQYKPLQQEGMNLKDYFIQEIQISYEKEQEG
jgi:hypothetical protein